MLGRAAEIHYHQDGVELFNNKGKQLYHYQYEITSAAGEENQKQILIMQRHVRKLQRVHKIPDDMISAMDYGEVFIGSVDEVLHPENYMTPEERAAYLKSKDKLIAEQSRLEAEEKKAKIKAKNKTKRRLKRSKKQKPKS